MSTYALRELEARVIAAAVSHGFDGDPTAPGAAFAALDFLNRVAELADPIPVETT